MRISLGESVPNKKEIFLPTAYYNNRQSSDSGIIVGMTGSGKSIIMRTIAFYYHKIRPVYIFDHAGRDHYFGYFPNQNPKNLAPNQDAESLRAYYLYYYNINARPRMKYERLVVPNFKKYNYKQFESLGFSGMSPANLQNILDEKSDIKSFKELNKLIYNSRKIAKNSKEPLLRDLNIKVISKQAWSLDNKKEIDYKKLIMTGKSAVFSFNDLEVAKAEINFFFNELQRMIDKYPKMKPPVLFFEEAHKIFSGSNDQELQRAIEDIILICRKLGIAVFMSLPTIQSIKRDVVGDIKQWFIGKLRGVNANEVKRTIDHPSIAEINRLPLDRHSNHREFIYFNSDKDSGFKFVPFECPQEDNRRV